MSAQRAHGKLSSPSYASTRAHVVRHSHTHRTSRCWLAPKITPPNDTTAHVSMCTRAVSLHHNRSSSMRCSPATSCHWRRAAAVRRLRALSSQRALRPPRAALLLHRALPTMSLPTQLVRRRNVSSTSETLVAKRSFATPPPSPD